MKYLMCSSDLFQTPLLVDVLCILDYKIVQFLRDRHTVDKGYKIIIVETQDHFHKIKVRHSTRKK